MDWLESLDNDFIFVLGFVLGVALPWLGSW